MEQFVTMTGRNLKSYFRDRSGVFFSLLSMFIIIGLMLFFLGDTFEETTVSILEGLGGRDAAADKENARLLILTWNFAGIIAVNGVTVTMAVYSVMIKDRFTGTLSSFYTAPISRSAIAGGYMAAAWTASTLVGMLTLLITEAYGVTQGMQPFSAAAHLKLTSFVVINSFLYAAFLYLLAMAAKTESAWSGLGTVIGTLTGFLGGIYIPIGSFGEPIRAIIKCTPLIYGTSMFRSVMTKEILETTFSGAPEKALEEYRTAMGIRLEIFGRTLSVTEEWLGLAVCGALCLGAGIVLRNVRKRADR